MTSEWIIVAGQPVFVRTFGDPESPVVLHLQGFGISGEYMTPTAASLEGFFSVVPDMPGFGRSPRMEGETTIPLLAQFASLVAAHYSAVPVTVVGNSLGCVVAVDMALNFPTSVSSVVLVSPAGGAANQPLPRAALQMVKDSVREPVSMAKVAVPDYLHFGVKDSLSLFGSMCSYPAFETMTKVDKPLLAVLGARDPLLPPYSRISEVMSVLPRAKVALLKNGAHALNYSHPREVSRLVEAFASSGSLQGVPWDASFSQMHVLQ